MGQAYELGIRNEKAIELGDLLMEAHWSSLLHLPIEIERKPRVLHSNGRTYELGIAKIEFTLVRCTWHQNAMTAEIEFELLDDSGKLIASQRCSQFMKLHRALRLILSGTRPQERIIVPSAEISAEIGSMMQIHKEATIPATQIYA